LSSESDLVVTADEANAESVEKNTSNLANGGGGVENFIGTAMALQNHDWDTAGLSALGLGVDLVGLAANPLATLASWGVGWAMEHVSFLTEPLNALAGDPNAIGGMASSWEKIGKELKSVANDYGQSASSTTGWEGKAGDAYRKLAADTAKTIDALGEACNGMKGAVDGAGAVVSAVRGIVRDLIAGALGEIIAAALKWVAAAACTAGIAIGGAIAEVISIALRWADKISGWMNKLADALKSLTNFLEKFGTAGKTVKTKVDEIFAGLASPPSGNVVKVQPQKALSEQNLTKAAEAALAENASPLKRGFAEYKPLAKGDIWKPNLDMGPDGGRAKFGYEVAKGVAATDDGKDQ
jgi:hypothetical protein